MMYSSDFSIFYFADKIKIIICNMQTFFQETEFDAFIYYEFPPIP